MTALAMTEQLDYGFLRSGNSPEARLVEKITNCAITHIRNRAPHSAVLNDLNSLRNEVEEDGGVIDEATFELAERFLFALPIGLPQPELSIDPDGEISFDWLGGAGRTMSVSLGGTGRISFAGMVGSGRTRYGTDSFERVVPKEILDAIRGLA